MSDKDQQVLEKFLLSDDKYLYNLTSNLDITSLVGNSLIADGLIEAFTEKSDEELKNGNNQYRKQDIISERLKYFELIGIDKSKLTSDYIFTSDALSHSPSRELISTLTKAKEKYVSLKEDEFLKVTSSYLSDIEKIKSLNLVEEKPYTL